MIRNVYLDNAATTPVHEQVVEKMLPFLKDNFGNPSSTHFYGRKTRVAIEESREIIANFIKADPSELYFTSGGTESNNLAINGISFLNRKETGKNEIVTSLADHHSVLDTVKLLEERAFKINLLRVNEYSYVTKEEFSKIISDKVNLVSLIHINNETGSINNIRELSSLAKEKDIIIHLDAVQSFGKIIIDVNELGIDSLSCSAHKINGPKGIGAIYIKSGTPINPILTGGSQERNRRGGTENVAGIVGFAEAVTIQRNDIEKNLDHAKRLKERMMSGISELNTPGIYFNNSSDFSPFILSVTLSSLYYRNDAEAMLMYLDINGVAASNGAACTSGTWKPSHVIISMGKSIEDAAGTIRFSFGKQNTIEEIDFAVKVFSGLIAKFRK